MANNKKKCQHTDTETTVNVIASRKIGNNFVIQKAVYVTTCLDCGNVDNEIISGGVVFAGYDST